MSNLKCQISNVKFVFYSYFLVILGLFLYSYTQVDLNLTLSEISIWQIIQKAFQHIGWFQRPLSTTLYIGIITFMTLYYCFFLWLAKSGKLKIKEFWKIVCISSIILLFSYNAFSYDLFNYMFDARIVTYHSQNPYFHKALDYPQDSWITFMRWTHRFYPYGPVWLFFTVPLSFIGFQFFLPTLFLFKSIAVLSYLGTIYFIKRILNRVEPSYSLLGAAFFAFNPLIIIESLVSAHNDILMIFLATAAFYFLMNKKYLRSILLLLLSIGVKFATVFLAPVFIVVFVLQARKKEIRWDIAFLSMIILMVLAIILASIRTTFQPWYLLYILPFTAFVVRKLYFLIPGVVVSAVILWEYIPYLYLGNWNPPVPSILNAITFSSLVLSIVFLIIYYSLQKKKRTLQLK